jgi:hypothetical protein
MEDVQILRQLAHQYAETAAKPVQEDRRALWRAHNSLKKTRPPVLVTYGMWNVWCREVFGDQAMQCKDPFYRQHERNLRMLLFHDTIGDDFILEPWINQRATMVIHPQGIWGIEETVTPPQVEGGAFKYDPPLKNWTDFQKLVQPHHMIDEEDTRRNLERIQEAVGDIIEVNLDRSPLFFSFDGDISTHLAYLRGLEQIMYDMTDSPQQLHALLAFMRDNILTAQAEGESRGDWNLANQKNQVMCYCEELEAPRANAGVAKRKGIWYHAAAQEFALVSPKMHEEFLLRYQLPVIENFGLLTYGCCEDLTRKIKMLRQIKNLRMIAVTPSADVGKCAEQIETDYVFSWRPNPANMVCLGFDRQKVKEIILRGMEDSKGSIVHVLLKDIETLEGETDRLACWTALVREIVERY